jgi:hypothetical protein
MADFEQRDFEQNMRARRAKWIARFRQRQVERRDWVNVGDVVNWSADLAGVFASRETAYDFIVKDALELRIEKLILLRPDGLQTLDSDRMQWLINRVRSEGARYEWVLSDAWMRQAAFEAFRSRYHLPEPPPHLRPRSPEESAIEEATERLAAAYRLDRHLKNDAATELLAPYHFTEVRRRNVRKKARTRANLSEKAEPGPKPKLV